MLKTILFDLDGTLIDSESFHLDCWNEVLSAFNIRLTLEEWIAHHAGVPMPANAGRLIEKHSLAIAHKDLVEKREDVTTARLKTHDINLMPFALETLEFFKEKGYTLALVTGSPRQDVEAIFDKNGLRHFFKSIITRSEVTNSKPHPESYELCCRELGVLVDDCIAFEDTSNGVKSAKAAGLVCYAIQNSTAEHHKLEAADKIFLNFNEAREYLIATGQIE
jgi:beta-phosphoglucomutase